LWSPVDIFDWSSNTFEHRGTEEAEEEWDIVFTSYGLARSPYSYETLKVLEKSTESLSYSWRMSYS
jgi:hypothetical protein